MNQPTMNQADISKRHYLMSFWRADMARHLASEEWAHLEDPAGLIIALDDTFGRPLGEALATKNGMTSDDIDKLVIECKAKGDCATLRLVCPAADARDLLQFTATTAQANFDRLDKDRRKGIDHFLIVIGYNGNSYGFVELLNRAVNPAKDGQNRTRRNM